MRAIFNVSAYRAARFTDRWMGKARTHVWVEGNLIFLYQGPKRSVVLVVNTSDLETPHVCQNKVRAYYGLPPISTS